MNARVFILIFLALSFIPALAQGEEDSDADIYDHRMAQGKLFMQKKWYQDAAQEFKIACETSKGREDFLCHMLMGEAFFMSNDLVNAVRAYRRARDLARTDEEKARAAKVLKNIRMNYGILKIEYASGGMGGTVVVVVKEKQPFISPEKKRILAAAKTQLLAGVSPPTLIYLPAGEYNIAGKDVEIKSGQETVVALKGAAAATKPDLESAEPFEPIYKKWWFWTGISIVLAAGAGAAVAAALATGNDRGVLDFGDDNTVILIRK